MKVTLLTRLGPIRVCRALEWSTSLLCRERHALALAIVVSRGRCWSWTKEKPGHNLWVFHLSLMVFVVVDRLIDVCIATRKSHWTCQWTVRNRVSRNRLQHRADGCSKADQAREFQGGRYSATHARGRPA